MAILPPPWGTAPPGVVLDGVVLPMRLPDTLPLVQTLLLPEDDPGAGLYVLGAFCTGDGWPRLVDMIVDPAVGAHITLAQLDLIADRVVQAHVGVPRWTAARLWQQAAGSWSLIDGEMTLRGIDLLTLPMQRATNAVYALLRSWYARGEKSALDGWQRKLDTPPLREIKRIQVEDVPVESASADDMAALMADLKSGRIGSRSQAAG